MEDLAQLHTGIVDENVELITTLLQKLGRSSSNAVQRVQFQLDDDDLPSLTIRAYLFGNLFTLAKVSGGDVDVGACQVDGLGCLDSESASRDTRDENNSSGPFRAVDKALIFDYLGSRWAGIPRALDILELVLLVVGCETCHVDGDSG